MPRRPPSSTRTASLLPDPTLFRSHPDRREGHGLSGSGMARAETDSRGRNAQLCRYRRGGRQAQGRARGGKRQWREQCRRSEEHTSELQSLMRISYAVFCLKKKKKDEHRKYSNLLQKNI